MNNHKTCHLFWPHMPLNTKWTCIHRQSYMLMNCNSENPKWIFVEFDCSKFLTERCVMKQSKSKKQKKNRLFPEFFFHKYPAFDRHRLAAGRTPLVTFLLWDSASNQSRPAALHTHCNSAVFYVVWRHHKATEVMRDDSEIGLNWPEWTFSEKHRKLHTQTKLLLSLRT